MGCRAKRVVEKGEGVLAATRRTEPAAPGAALGKSRQGLCVRWAEGQGDTGGSLRRAKPIDRVSLYARPGLEGRLPELLVHFGPYPCQRGASGSARLHAARGLASPAAPIL